MVNLETDAKLRRVVQRLNVDPELEQEVIHELRTQIDDTAAAIQDRDTSDDEASNENTADAKTAAAENEAFNQLGDPDELAEQLWQANRTRLRYRAYGNWLARLLIVPLAIYMGFVYLPPNTVATTHILAAMGVVSPVENNPTSVQLAVNTWMFSSMPRLMGQRLMQEARAKWNNSIAFTPETLYQPNAIYDQSGLSKQEKLLFTSRPVTPNQDLLQLDERLAMHQARIAAFRDTDKEAILQADLIHDLMVDLNLEFNVDDQTESTQPREIAEDFLLPGLGFHKREPMTREEREQQQRMKTAILEASARGRQLDPDNAFFPLTQMRVHFAAAIVEFEEVDTDTFETVNRRIIQSEDELQKAYAALDFALNLPQTDPLQEDLFTWKFELLGSPSHLPGYIARQYEMIFTLLPSLSRDRQFARELAHQAEALAIKGRWAEAEQMQQRLNDFALLIGSKDSGVVIELLVAMSIESLAMESEIRLGELQNNTSRIESAQARKDAIEVLRKSNFGADGSRDTELDFLAEFDQQMRLGLVGQSLSEIDSLDAKDFELIRKAEYFFFDRAGLGLIASMLMTMLLWATFRSTVRLVAAKRHQTPRPLLIFVGWKRLLRVLVLAMVLPLTTYGLWVWSPWGGRTIYGLNLTAGKVLTEQCILLATIVTVMRIEIYRAVNARAIELGIAIPDLPPWSKRYGLMVGTGLVLGLYVWLYPAQPAMLWLDESVWTYGLMVLPLLVALGSWLGDVRRVWRFELSEAMGRKALKRGIIFLLVGILLAGILYTTAVIGRNPIAVSAVIPVMLGLWGLVELAIVLWWLKPTYGQMLVRSSQVMLGAAVILMSLIFGGLSQFGERQALQATDSQFVFNELESPQYEHYKAVKAEYAQRWAERRISND